NLWCLSISLLFPYTTLFRSFFFRFCIGANQGAVTLCPWETGLPDEDAAKFSFVADEIDQAEFRAFVFLREQNQARIQAEQVLPRSEEHTSELQSLRHLVCRL